MKSYVKDFSIFKKKIDKNSPEFDAKFCKTIRTHKFGKVEIVDLQLVLLLAVNCSWFWICSSYSGMWWAGTLFILFLLAFLSCNLQSRMSIRHKVLMLALFACLVCRAYSVTHYHWPEKGELDSKPGIPLIAQIVSDPETRRYGELTFHFKRLGNAPKLRGEQNILSYLKERFSKGCVYMLKTPDVPWNSLVHLHSGDQFLVSKWQEDRYFNKDLSGKLQNPFSYQAYLRRQGICNVVKALGENVSGFARSSGRFKESLQDTRFETFRRSDGFNVIAAAFLGDKAHLPLSIIHLFRRTGLAHILVVSGFHVGMVFAFGSLIGGILWKLNISLMLRMPRKVVRAYCGFVFALVYALNVGLTATVMRAMIVLTVYTLGEVIGRRGFSRRTLLLSFLILLFIWPGYYLELSCQLSYAALASLLWLNHRLSTEQVKHSDILLKNVAGYSAEPTIFLKLKNFLRNLLSVSIVAWSSTSIVIFCWFGTCVVYGWLMNAIFAPLLTIICVCLGGLSLTVLHFSDSIGVMLMKSTIWLADILLSQLRNADIALSILVKNSIVEFVLILIPVLLLVFFRVIPLPLWNKCRGLKQQLWVIV